MTNLWRSIFSTFELYLAHPASTVRQATSAIFKFLVAKDSSSSAILMLVLQGLAAGWQPNLADFADSVAAPCPRLSTNYLSTGCCLCVDPHACAGCNSIGEALKETGVPVGRTWEWREGRLLAYELILKVSKTRVCGRRL
jgi:hypothetical protein